MASTLPADTEFRLPDLSVVSASAGAGKTHTLTMRALQFLLSRRIPHTQLREILAITFTNNAANEMKQRILRYLKEIAVRDPKTLGFVRELVGEDDEVLVRRATDRLEEILDSYSDLRVSTIDSFVIALFQSAALELGYNPGTEVSLDAEPLLREAFDDFTKDPQSLADHRSLIMGLTALMERGRSRGYVWDPYAQLFRRTRELYSDLRMLTKPLNSTDESVSLESASNAVAAKAAALLRLLEQSGLPVYHHFQNDLKQLADGGVMPVLGRTIKEKFFNKTPKGLETAFVRYDEQVRVDSAALYQTMGQYALASSRLRYYPFTRFLELLETRIADAARRGEKIALDDINRSLKDKLNRGIVPDIYFKLGENIHHYLIDEFQDTSPIQWHILKPLLEETLSGNGSLFVVGDTKQSIYGFRGADWRIMNGLMTGMEFESVKPFVAPLGTNFRSSGAVLEFAQRLFLQAIPATEYADAAVVSGLSSFEQEVVNKKKKKGFVSYTVLEATDDLGSEEAWLMEHVRSLTKRGFGFRDIAILTPANRSVTRISAWLNKQGIPFISHSNLDIRNRQAVRELLALVKFLDAPVDNVAFSTLLLGSMFQRSVQGIDPSKLHEFIFAYRTQTGARRPLYKLFQQQYPVIWQRLFQPLFVRVGYSPLYDLLSDIFKMFDVFGRLPEEEAALVKLLEVVRAFEREGMNSIKEFVAFADEEGSSDAWTLGAPPSSDAVTVMTVHKAKGLDFPAVIVYLEDKVPEAGNLVIEDEGETVRLLHIDKTLCAHSPELRRARDHALLMEQADALNQLYVALTRAKDEMHVLCTFTKELKGPMKALPESFEIGTAAAWESDRDTESARMPVPLLHHAVQRDYPLTITERPGLRETQRGELIHEILAGIQFLEQNWGERLDGDVAARIQSAAASFAVEAVQSVLRQFLETADVNGWFQPKNGRRVMTEQEFVTAEGSLYRCDRIIIDESSVTVIDFKTGGNAPEDEYRLQVKTYCTILKEIFPGSTVRGLIAYVDMRYIVEV